MNMEKLKEVHVSQTLFEAICSKKNKQPKTIR